MTADSSFPEKTRRAVRAIQFVLRYFWFIITFLAGVVVCCALATFLEVALNRPQALALSAIFTLVAWVLIFMLTLLRQIDWETTQSAANPPFSLPGEPHDEV